MIRIEKILVPTDFSDCSRKAVEFGVELAKLLDAEILLLHAMAPPVYPAQMVMEARDVGEMEGKIRGSCEEHLAELQKEVAGQGVRSQTIVEQGPPLDEIMLVARKQDVDLIVIGTHGHTGMKHLLLGSTAEKVVRKAPCPVVTVKGEEGDAA